MAQAFTAENITRMTQELIQNQLPQRLMENYMANAQDRGRLEINKLGVIAKQKIIDAIPAAIINCVYTASDSLYTGADNLPEKNSITPFIAGLPNSYAAGVKGGYGSPVTTNFYPMSELMDNMAYNMGNSMERIEKTFSKEVTTIASREIITSLEPFAKENARIAMERVRKPELRNIRRKITSTTTAKVGPFYYYLEIPPEGSINKVKEHYTNTLEKLYDYMKEIVVISQVWSGLPFIVRPRLFTQSVRLMSDLNYRSIVDALFSVTKVRVSLESVVRAIPGSKSSQGRLEVDYTMNLDLTEIDNMLSNMANSAVSVIRYRNNKNVIRAQGKSYRMFFGQLEEYIRYSNTGFRHSGPSIQEE